MEKKQNTQTERMKFIERFGVIADAVIKHDKKLLKELAKY